jgi:hypothetical protein
MRSIPMTTHTRTLTLRAHFALVLAAALMVGCLGGAGARYADDTTLGAVAEAPLGGEALSQRKQDLERAYRDISAFYTTILSLIDRRDTRGSEVFEEFVGEYMGRHLDPLIRAGWQSSHPEVMAMDATLRFMKAEMLVQMRYPRRVQDVIEDIEVRYAARGSLLVDYPVGQQTTLTEALVILKDRKWGG